MAEGLLRRLLWAAPAEASRLSFALKRLEAEVAEALELPLVAEVVGGEGLVDAAVIDKLCQEENQRIFFPSFCRVCLISSLPYVWSDIKKSKSTAFLFIRSFFSLVHSSLISFQVVESMRDSSFGKIS